MFSIPGVAISDTANASRLLRECGHRAALRHAPALLDADAGEFRHRPRDAFVNAFAAFLRDLNVTDRIARAGCDDGGPQHDAFAIERAAFDQIALGMMRVPGGGAAVTLT